MMHSLVGVFMVGFLFVSPSDAVAEDPVMPEMVRIPGGTLWTGCAEEGDGTSTCEDHEETCLPVTLEDFEVGVYEVTFDEWDACTKDGGCQPLKSGWTEYAPAELEEACEAAWADSEAATACDEEGFSWGRGKQPAINVSWDDAQIYITWLNKKTGKRYRLLTEVEWEYAARGDRTGQHSMVYSWGNEASYEYANYGWKKDDLPLGYTSGRDQWSDTAPVGQFPSNAFGLHDMHGNVWEWTDWTWAEDCRVSKIDEDKAAASSKEAISSASTCKSRPVRGGSHHSPPGDLRVTSRMSHQPNKRSTEIGFRLARSLSDAPAPAREPRSENHRTPSAVANNASTPWCKAEVLSKDLMKPVAGLPDVILGSTEAAITVVGYSSMTCTHCARFHLAVLPALKCRYIDTGKARLVMREFPLDNNAAAAAMLLRCADAKIARSLESRLYRSQAYWTTSGSEMPRLREIAMGTGMTAENVDNCLRNEELLEALDKARGKAASDFGVAGTPAFFVNSKCLTTEIDGKRALTHDLRHFDGIIEELLTKP